VQDDCKAVDVRLLQDFHCRSGGGGRVLAAAAGGAGGHLGLGRVYRLQKSGEFTQTEKFWRPE
jgi:hypothetical protein